MNSTPEWDYDDIPPPPPEFQGEQPRHGSNHMFTAHPGRRARDVWAAERYNVNGWRYRDIANAMGISTSTAWDRVQRGLLVIEAPTIAAAERARAAHRARLEAATEVAFEVMAKDHIHVSQGRVVKGDDGKPVIDDGPKLAAADRIRSLSESLRKLDGLDAATKVDANVTVNPQDIELAQLIQQAEAANQGREAQIKGEDQQ